MQAVTFLEQLERPLRVTGVFEEPLRIPLTSRHAEEIPTVHVNGAGQTADRVGNGVDDIMAKGEGVAFAEGFRTYGLDSTIWLAWDPAPQNIVLAARVDADDGQRLWAGADNQ